MKLSDLRPNDGANKKRKRVARGPGSGHGKTATRGHKGQKSRSGGRKNSARFEGGRSTQLMRLPKRGMSGAQPGAIERVQFQVVNVADLGRVFAAGSEVTPLGLVKAGLVRPGYPVKVLGNGNLAVALKIQAHQFSQSAAEKIQAAGGSANVLGTEGA